MKITPMQGPFQNPQPGRTRELPEFTRPTPPQPPAPSMETELGPARTMPGFDNSAENIRSEAKIDGKVIARIYNSGAMEIAGAYADKLHNIKGLGKGAGPDYADVMVKALKEALAQFGASFAEASTAISHEMWLEETQASSGKTVDQYA